MRFLPLFALVALTVTGCEKTAPSSPEQTAAAKLLSDLAVFAHGEPLDVEDSEKLGRKLTEGSLTVDQYIDDLMERPIGARLAKDLVIAPNTGVKDRHPVPAHSTLRSSKDGGETVYYLKKKCSAADAEKVLAWWGEEVLVCKDSHRPDVKGDSAGRTCGASMLAPREDDTCGCGPRLMWCTKDSDQLEVIKNAINGEITETAGYVVDSDLPIEQLFTMNETVRSKYAELLYRRARIAAGESLDLLPIKDFGDRAERRPRVEQVPGQHAGVLSSPGMTYASDALRGVMRNYYDYLWCSGMASSGVTTQAVMDLEVVDLRVGDGWKKLAEMNICTDCHARLDYGMQFFWGYPSSTQGVDFRPGDVRKGKGKLYSRDIQDERGEDELTPAGFARLVTAQPEFGKCMTRKIVDHVFSGSDDEVDFKAVQEVFEKTHRVKPMLRMAMQRYAERHKKGTPPVPTVAAVTVDAAVVDDNVKLTKALREMLDDRCMSCHDDDDRHDFNGAALPHRTLASMLDQVAFGAMPKTAMGLDEVERLAFVRQLSAHVFADENKRKIAEDYFANGMRGYPVHRFRSAMMTVGLRVDHGGRVGYIPTAIEGSIDQSQSRYSPSIGLSAAMTGLKGCRAAKLKGPELEACVERTTAPGNVVVGALAR